MIFKWIKNIFKKKAQKPYKKIGATYIEENGRVFLKTDRGLLSDDFRSSGESEKSWKSRIMLKKIRKDRLEKLKELNKYDSIN